MEVILGLFFFIIAFGSIITTSVAIFQIIKNDFNGSKGLWILISMIGIIGPILYLIKGRRLIIKNNHNIILNIERSNSKKQYYIDLMSELDVKIKYFLGISICLIIFGYLVRLFGLYIFWESKPLGFVFLLVSILIILRKDITIRKSRKLNNILSHIGFWLISFLLFVKFLMLIILLNSDAYIATKDYLKNNKELKEEIGEVTGFVVLPSGQIEVTSDSSGTYGYASINLIIKGETKYDEKTIYLDKTVIKDWAVIALE